MENKKEEESQHLQFSMSMEESESCLSLALCNCKAGQTAGAAEEGATSSPIWWRTTILGFGPSRPGLGWAGLAWR